MGGQNSLKITYGKSRLLERKKKRKRKKKKEHLWKVIYIKKNTHLIELFAIPKKKKNGWLNSLCFKFFFKVKNFNFLKECHLIGCHLVKHVQDFKTTHII